ncbi:MAG: methyl-accepting chemotaxis protein [Pseudomonadota bacterium]
MNWFTTVAPIRMKLLVAFGSLTGLTALAAIGSIFTGSIPVIVIGLAATLASAVLSVWFRTAISVPYVSTVVRMEGLAAGDLSSQIAYTDYADCVGRMTKAMFVFRDAAVAQQAQAAEQAMIVQTLRQGLEELSQGNLTHNIETAFPPAYEELRANFNQAVDSLRDLIGSVIESTSTIRTGSGEIAQASEDLARRTEGNASSLEETTAAITQMDGRLKATAAAASRTVERADGAITTVSGGRAVADEAVQAMGRVSESAKGIDSVIEGLDKIAFQTRVLAMNAAVEAGRAGDAGRGFAVVADLVSALAMRAEEESKRARDQLTVTQTDIVAAVGAVEKVDAALVNISGDVGEVHKLLGEMAADNQAQSVAVTQISSAIGTMDQATQQNAAMVEETSAAARNLTSEVAALADQAARFNIGAAQGSRVAARAPAPARARQAATSARPASTRALPVAAMANGAGSKDDWASF